jgi:hypothetical protein
MPTVPDCILRGSQLTFNLSCSRFLA